jgi:tRNA threonylcarbamoyladenosine biosynthesis protein TsaB
LILFLAIETSGRAGSVALLSPDFLCYVETLPDNAGSAKTLTPAIDRLFRKANAVPKDLVALFLITGPGSFTGLRVGVATAKAMAYALNIPVVEVDALDAIALQNRSYQNRIHIVMDAYRGQVFYAAYDISETPSGMDSSFASEVKAASDLEKWKLGPTRILDIASLLEDWSQQPKTQARVVCGPGCDRIRKYIAEQKSESSSTQDLVDVTWIDGISSIPQAQSVAAVGFSAWATGTRQDPFALMPHYYRASAAEEKRDSNVLSKPLTGGAT